ncbi:hypothetical protein ACTWPT_55790 [Nonomuraea sp. 3N208]|uniref:hypothetical protein n=1 Tax=Nonomuraea sp. 3N208 TaxID=3457421 RepID=UPI003FD13CCE
MIIFGHSTAPDPMGILQPTRASGPSACKPSSPLPSRPVEDGIRRGREDRVSTTVLDLTGRPPRTFARFVSEHANEWRAK